MSSTTVLTRLMIVISLFGSSSKCVGPTFYVRPARMYIRTEYFFTPCTLLPSWLPILAGPDPLISASLNTLQKYHRHRHIYLQKSTTRTLNVGRISRQRGHPACLKGREASIWDPGVWTSEFAVLLHFPPIFPSKTWHVVSIFLLFFFLLVEYGGP